MPTEIIQMLMLLLTSALFAAAFVLGYRHMRQVQSGATAAGGSAGVGLPHEASIGPPARAAVAAALAVGAGLLVWRGLTHGTLGLPATDPFDAFLLLGLLLALVVIYFRWTRHLRSLSFFLLPMIVVLLLIGLGLAQVSHAGGAGKHDYGSFWLILHVVTIGAGTLCFALGCVGGGVYLLADRQLKHKGMDPSHRWSGLPPLASMERFNLWMVYMGFPLLTVATVAGILRIVQNPAASSGGGMQVKVALGALAWLVYLVLAHVPLNPRFRGRRAAWLLIIGFAMFIGAYIVSSWS